MNNEDKKETQSAEQTAPAPETEQPRAQQPKPATAPQNEKTEETESPAQPEKAEKTDKQAAKTDKKESRKLKEEVAKLQDELAAAKTEQEQEKDRLLRTVAEYDNYRKRTEREKTALYADATADTVKEFLSVADNLERALEQETCSAEDLRKGVEMVQKQMTSALEKLGVESMGAAGEPFDAQLHNAVSHVEDGDLGENVIAEVYQKGYRLGDKVVRHAMVKVAN
ncbi:MAG: nucleotide exchange factor GrpE [Oscillospiraceae bacterium]|nr:nucleotide exchange factor GrpE [Oscillospiraceae bacterium]